MFKIDVYNFVFDYIFLDLVNFCILNMWVFYLLFWVLIKRKLCYMFFCGNCSDFLFSVFDFVEFKDLSFCVVMWWGIEFVNSLKVKVKFNIFYFIFYKILEMVFKFLFFFYSGGYFLFYVYWLVSELYYVDDNYLW